MKMPTSSTGKTSAVPDAPAPGFTLMELLVVLTIVALVAAVAAPRLVGSGVAARLEADARAVEDMLDRARLTALSGNRDTMVTVDMAGGILTGPNGAQTQLQSARVSSMTTAEALVTGETGRFRFFSDGSSTGGRLTLAAEDLTRTVTLDWLTGEARRDGGTGD